MNYQTKERILLSWNELIHSPVIMIVILAADVCVVGYVLYSIFDNSEKNNLFEEYGKQQSEDEKSQWEKLLQRIGIIVVGIANFLFIITRVI